MNFWSQLEKPIFGLAPMDGITDAAFRHIVARHAKPDVLLTEFTNVEGLARNAAVMLDDFAYSDIERPIVAQIYGSEPESFYQASVLACALGFDGIDVNMGCPAKKVAARGCGAALIQNPSLAKTILRQVKRAIRDWSEGLELTALGLKPRMRLKVQRMNLDRNPSETAVTRRLIPLSVKTRIGYDRVTVCDWVQHLLEEAPALITLHGRTLKQGYSGSADWESIARAAEIVHQTPTQILGNGDVPSLEVALERVRLSGVDGVLIGRSAIGAPWIFRNKAYFKNSFASRNPAPASFDPEDLNNRFEIMLEHARYFEQVKGPKRFAALRKQLGCYCRGLRNAAELRRQLFQTQSSAEVEAVLAFYQRRETMHHGACASAVAVAD